MWDDHVLLFFGTKMRTQLTARRYGKCTKEMLECQRPTPDPEDQLNSEEGVPQDGPQQSECGVPMDGHNRVRECTMGAQIVRKPSWFFGPIAEPLRRVLYAPKDIYQHAATMWRMGYSFLLGPSPVCEEEILASEWTVVDRCHICNKCKKFDLCNDLVCDNCYLRISNVYKCDPFLQSIMGQRKEEYFLHHDKTFEKDERRHTYVRKVLKGKRRSMGYELSKSSHRGKAGKFKTQSGEGESNTWLYDIVSVIFGWCVYGPLSLIMFVPRICAFIKEYWRLVRFVPLIYNHTDLIAREITLLVSLKMCIMSARDNKGVGAAITMYLQAHSQKSLLGHVTSAIFQFLRKQTPIDNESLYEGISQMQMQSGESESDWLDSVRKCLSNWHKYIDSPQSRNCKKLISYIVSAGMCEASSLTFSVGGYKLYEPRVIEATIGPLELIDVIASCVIEFVEGGYAVFQTGNVSSFFMLNTTTQEFDKNYDKVRDCHGYAITGNLGEYTDMTDNDYEQLLDVTIQRGDTIVGRSKRMTPERKFIMDRLEKLRAWRTEFTQMRTRGGFRLAPFALSLYGNTGVGKSSLNKLTYEAIGTYNGFDVKEDRVAIWADNDKYASNIRSSTNVIIFDDFGNTSPQFTDTSPVYRLIQTINNALFLAPMADVAMKGKVALRPWLVTVTTNKRYLLAETYSEKPESVLRRLYHVDVDVREEYKSEGRLDSKKVFAAFGPRKDPDIWLITVNFCYVGPELVTKADKNHYEFRVLEFEGEPFMNKSVYEYLRWAQLASREHYTFQKQMVSTMTSGKPIDVCATCGLCYCSCPPHLRIVEPSICPVCGVDDCTCTMGASDPKTRLPLEIELQLDYAMDDSSTVSGFREQSGRSLSMITSDFRETAKCLARSTFNSFTQTSLGSRAIRYMRDVNEARIQNLSLELAVERDILFDAKLVDLVPVFAPQWLIDSCFSEFLSSFFRMAIFGTPIAANFFLATLCYIILWFYTFFGLLGIAWAVSSVILVGAWCVYLERERLRSDLLLRRSATYSAYVRVFRSRSAACFAGSLLGYCAYKMCKNYFKWRAIMEPQGNLCPSRASDIADRSGESNPWSSLVLSSPIMSVESKTTIGRDLAEVAARNTVYLETNTQFTRGFFVRSNVLVLPWHFCVKCWDKGDFIANVFRAPLNTTTPNFRATISKSFAVKIPDVDFALVWCPSGGLFKDLTQYLIRDGTCTGEALFLLKEKDGSNAVFPTKCIFPGERVSHTQCTDMLGVHYELPFETKPGMCMSPVLSSGKGSCIVGFHLCGSGNIGGAASLYASSYRSAERLLAEIPGVNIAVSATVLPETHMGEKLVQGKNISPKCASRFVSPGATLEVYGETSGAATQYSNVVNTVISPHVTAVTGVECKWGKPPKRLPDGSKLYPFQVGLDVLAHPSLSLGAELITAIQSYLYTIKENEFCMSECSNMTPLDLFTTINGKQGDKFLEGMKLSTSAGWPFSKSKRDLVVPQPTNELAHAVTFTPEIMAEVEEARNKLLEGCRVYAVWRACLKDEPTKLTALKVRIFQCAPLVLQILLRQYFLPISRLMQLFPLEFECMVGINAESPEWEQMFNFMVSKSRINVFAGDYGKYDLRMPAQLVLAAFDVLIRIATLANYTLDDIQIMKGLACEVAYPLMAFNGTLIQFFGSNPSGQNMTVVINSIVNSLLARSCYYSLYSSVGLRDFRDNVAIGTYGDDVMGSVSDERKKFNILSFSEYVAKYDIVFTMPNKEDELVPFMDLDSADFLKRHNYYNADLGCNIGLLDDMSIFKRLHCTMDSSFLSNRELSALALETSLRDWFYAGRAVFERRQSQLLEIADRAQLTHLCPELKVSYDRRVTKWREKYLCDAKTPNSIGVT